MTFVTTSTLRQMSLPLILALAACTSAENDSDRRRIYHLSDLATQKEAAALSTYKKREAKAAAEQLSDLIHVYEAIVTTNSLGEVDLRYWNYMLMLAHGRLGNTYGWMEDQGAKAASLKKAMEYSKVGLNRPLTSEAEVEKYVADVDKNL